MGSTNYLLKCDLSGIQTFIFNVPSKGAAKALKNRSVYVQEIADDCLKVLRDYFGQDNSRELYNGGGNFYLQVDQSEKTPDEIKECIAEIQQDYLQMDVFPHITFVHDQGQPITELLERIQKEVQRAKLRRPIPVGAYMPSLLSLPDRNIADIEGVNGQVPRDEDRRLMDFSDIAALSEGDEKLAALKLDVDNLGQVFYEKTEEEYKELSARLKDFFDTHLLELITVELGFRRHIYVVFSGGDDCFLIGSWDKVFQLAIRLRQKFEHFQRELRKEVPSIKEDMTFSAGITVIPSAYPMTRLSTEAEDALSASKRVVGKDSITVFGRTLTWKEFEKSQRLAGKLYDLVSQRGESKSLINRIKSSDIGYSKLQHRAAEGRIDLPRVWRLKYYLRVVRAENRSEIESIFDEYKASIIDAFMHKRGVNPDLYPVAARWAELLLK